MRGKHVMHNFRRRLAAGTMLAVLGLATGAGAQSNDVEWPSYTADLTGSRYRPLDQINASNFNNLQVAWRFKTDKSCSGVGPTYQTSVGECSPVA